MTSSETEIMRYFRRYDVGAGQMLFFDTSPASNDGAAFAHAMDALIRRGLVVQERPRCAYSLTDLGYRASRSA
jgi:hypothetical protein